MRFLILLFMLNMFASKDDVAHIKGDGLPIKIKPVGSKKSNDFGEKEVYTIISKKMS